MLVYRENRLFKINIEELPPKARNSGTINALYADMYLEFIEANTSFKYKNLTYQQRMQEINNFANSWLIQRGLK